MFEYIIQKISAYPDAQTVVKSQNAKRRMESWMKHRKGLT